MMRLLLAITVAVACPALAQQEACPGATKYTWQGDENASWSVPQNWDLDAVPGANDIAYIPSIPGGQQFPEISGSGAQVCALQLKKTGSRDPQVTVKSGSGEQVLYIYGQNGLDVGAGCEIRLEKDQSLSLISPGIVKLDGKIVFKSSQDQERPNIFFPEGATILQGSGQILGETRGRLFGPGGNEELGWLVVGTGNALYGELQVEVGLINNGIVDPLISPNDHPAVVSLTCMPKLGSGQWNITGGTETYRNRIDVNVDVASTGTVTIGNYGELHLNRNMMVSGGITMEGNGKFVVPWFILFDVRQFATMVCDYTGS
ncbi:MAG: hypothetical protein IT449_09845 [Phycisphaerales bacterium]|nr:hypothetical protein [Phycisphaerales bacterium]